MIPDDLLVDREESAYAGPRESTKKVLKVLRIIGIALAFLVWALDDELRAGFEDPWLTALHYGLGAYLAWVVYSWWEGLRASDPMKADALAEARRRGRKLHGLHQRVKSHPRKESDDDSPRSR